MKIIHISDIHIHPQPLLGLDPIANFEKCLAHIETYHQDADRIIITGDLTHRGSEESYDGLKAILAASSLSNDLAPRLLIGNHDRRDAFIEAFPQTNRDNDGYIQWSELTPAGLFIYMDTAETGIDAGRYGADRQAWLRAELEKTRKGNHDAWLFMHHNPIAVHVANADMIGILEEAELHQILRDYRDQIRHIFFGHCHFTLSGAVAGIPFSAPRSTSHTCWPDFSGIVERMGVGDLQPNYNVCFLRPHGVVIHSIDFLDEDKVIWLVDD